MECQQNGHFSHLFGRFCFLLTQRPRLLIGDVLCLVAVQLPPAELRESQFNVLSSRGHIYEIDLPCLQHCFRDVCLSTTLRDLPAGCDRGSGIDLHRQLKKNACRMCFFTTCTVGLQLKMADPWCTYTFMHISVDKDIAIYVRLTLFSIIQLHSVFNAAASRIYQDLAYTVSGRSNCTCCQCTNGYPGCNATIIVSIISNNHDDNNDNNNYYKITIMPRNL